jgi:hypothetical protein
MTQFEHLELPITNINFVKRPKRGFGGQGRRADRNSHGRQLLAQASAILDRPRKQYTPFGINPKLVFKIKLREESDLTDDQIISSGLNLLAKEPKSKQALIVFSSDDELNHFKQRLKIYSGLEDSKHEYGYLDAIEELVPLEPQDRRGRLLELEPLESGELVPLDLELWHTGDNNEMENYINELGEFLRNFQEYPGMKVTDKYIGEYLCLARIKIVKEVLEEILLEEDAVKEIDRRPRPAFESPKEINIPLSKFSQISSPSPEACGILVIDSGVQRGHPLIAPALGDTEVFPDENNQFITGGPDDGDQRTGGHGTGVCGIALYGNVNQSLQEKSFQPSVWLFSARVTNENNEYDPDLLLEKQIEQSIDYFVRNYSNCKVINISLGDSQLFYQDGQKQFRLAAKIDEIAYRLQHKNILFVISAGNFSYQPVSNELVRQKYPDYLLNDEAHIIEPATSAIALTVGSLSMGQGSSQYPEDASRNAIAKVEGYPSPFTRTGFGVDGMIKPELVDFGGDLVLDRNRIVPNELGASIITLAKNFQEGSLFQAFCGTSFAAPRVANLAAKLFTRFPNASSNLIRALIANSAELPLEVPANLQGSKPEHNNQRLKIYGYGQPNFEIAAYSTENKVVLLEDDQIIPVGNFQIYEIPPLPDDFLNTQGSRKISVTLAFDPPTRHTRGDSYLGVTMEFCLFRNVDLTSLQGAFKDFRKNDRGQLTETENSTEILLQKLKNKFGSHIQLNLFPNANTRKKGTLQKGEIIISRKNWKYDGKPLYIVVICNRKWAREEEVDVQRYALVASISHSNSEVDLYNHLRLKTRIAQRVRLR